MSATSDVGSVNLFLVVTEVDTGGKVEPIFNVELMLLTYKPRYSLYLKA